MHIKVNKKKDISWIFCYCCDGMKDAYEHDSLLHYWNDKYKFLLDKIYEIKYCPFCGEKIIISESNEEK